MTGEPGVRGVVLAITADSPVPRKAGLCDPVEMQSTLGVRPT